MVKFITTVVVFITSVSACCAKPTVKIRVLMITGVDHPAHHWTMTAPAIREALILLATARSKVTGKQHPMAFVLEYGEGRVFHSSLGHDVRAIQTPGTAKLIRRGCAWAASRKPSLTTLEKQSAKGIR